MNGAVAWHRFTGPDTHLVTLTVQDNNGVSDSTSQAIQVGATSLPPTAAFTYSPVSPGVAEWVRFDGTGSSDPDGTIIGYTWSFGDGTPSVGGSAVYHQFAAPGTYLATLTVQDNDAATDSTSRTIVVGTAGQPPVAAFTYSPLTPAVGQPVLLNAQSSYDPDGTIVSYFWDLDGNGSDDMTGSLGQVTYQSVGTPGEAKVARRGKPVACEIHQSLKLAFRKIVATFRLHTVYSRLCCCHVVRKG